jgi:hypothetical protein
MIDSDDRDANFSSPWDFQITKRESILNGFFTRIATTEVCLDWCDPNISSELKNNTIVFDISGTGANTYKGLQTVTVNTDFYTIENIVDEVVAQLDAVSGTTGVDFSVSQINGSVFIDASGGDFTVQAGKLQNQLDLFNQPDGNSIQVGNCADIRPYRYIDFVSTDLTYAQYLKDSSTAKYPRDVLCRWYFAEDSQENLDGYGFPILQGYKTFCRRRIFNPPKYIRWDNNLPIGNMKFMVYDDTGTELAFYNTTGSSWLMTLQVSEN